jgi:hypothetical protein
MTTDDIGADDDDALGLSSAMMKGKRSPMRRRHRSTSTGS